MTWQGLTVFQLGRRQPVLHRRLSRRRKYSFLCLARYSPNFLTTSILRMADAPTITLIASRGSISNTHGILSHLHRAFRWRGVWSGRMVTRRATVCSDIFSD